MVAGVSNILINSVCVCAYVSCVSGMEVFSLTKISILEYKMSSSRYQVFSVFLPCKIGLNLSELQPAVSCIF